MSRIYRCVRAGALFFCIVFLFGGIRESICSPAVAEFPGPLLSSKAVSSAPVIDGKLNDTCWKEAVEAGNFTLLDGSGFAKDHTSAYVCNDAKYLYIAFRCRERILDPALNQLDRFKATVTERDSLKIFGDDSVEIFLAAGEDPSTYYHIVVNSLGTVYDAKGFSNPESWNAGIEAAGKKGNGEWTVEMRIPFADLGETPGPGDVWRINLCRNEPAAGETSCWSPVPGRFHAPASFGYLRFIEAGPAISVPVIPSSITGEQILSVPVSNPASRPMRYSLRMVSLYDHEPVIRETSETLLPGSSRDLAVRYAAGKDNRCLRIDADNKSIVCSHTGRIVVKPDTVYHFSAMVRTKDFNYPGGSYPLFVMEVFRQDGTSINRGYEPIGVQVKDFPQWTLVEGTWRSAPDTWSVCLWLVSWTNHGSGTFWIDDMVLTEEGKNENLLTNGTFPKGQESFGWTLIGTGSSFDDSYGAGAEAFSWYYQILAPDGTVVYQSPKTIRHIESTLAIVNSFIGNVMTSGGWGREFTVLPIRKLFVAEDTVQEFSLVLTSPSRRDVAKVCFQMDLPRSCRLVNYFTPEEPAGPVPLSWQEQDIMRDGRPYRRYLLTFGQDAVVTAGALPPEYLFIPLLMKVSGSVPVEDSTCTCAYRAYLEDGRGEAKDYELPMEILPPLQGKQPAALPVICWAEGTMFGYGLKGRELVYATRAGAGFNCAGIPIHSEETKSFERLGLMPFNCIPPLFLGGAAGWSTLLSTHPEYAERDSANNENRDAVCMAELLDKNSPFWKEIQAVITDLVRFSPKHLDLDFEFPICEGASSGFSARNLAVFRKRAGIPGQVVLTPEKILKDYRAQWIDFRCWENAEFVRFCRDCIKKANRDCLFSMYSGWQGPGTAEAYGVDWKYMGPAVDLVICGYDRGTPAATMRAAGRNYVCGGEALLGSYDMDSFENTFFQRLTECGSLMAYYARIIDGRFYRGVSHAAAVAADFEEFFLNLEREDTLVTGDDGKQRNDVAVFTHGDERLIVVFNNTPREKTAVLRNGSLPAGAVGVDYETKLVLKNPAEIKTVVKPWSVNVIYVAVPAKRKSGLHPPVVPLKKQDTDSEYPILRWQDPEGRTRRYTVQYSQEKTFRDAVFVRDIAQPFCLLETPQATGKILFWRVRATDVLTGNESGWSAIAGMAVVPSRAGVAVSNSGKPDNKGFDRLGYWPFGGVVEHDYTVTCTKTYSLKITSYSRVSYGNSYTYNPDVGTRLIPVQPGEKYTFRTKVKIEGDSEASIAFTVHGKNGRFLPDAIQKMKGTGDWRELDVSMTIPSGGAYMGFWIQATGGPGTVWFDDFSLIKQ